MSASRGRNQTTSSSWAVPWLCAAALAVLILLIYYPVFGFGFVSYDDEAYVSKNAAVQDGLTLESLRWAWQTRYYGNWHPLLWMSYLLDSELFDMHPGGFHATNVWLHILATLVLFATLREMTSATGRSFAVAALFAANPQGVEAVAWISERKGTLSTLFWMLAIYAYARYARTERAYWKVLTLLATVCGLMAKPMLLTMPLALLLLDFWPLKRWNPLSAEQERTEPVPLPGTARKLIWEKSLLCVLVVVFAVIAYRAHADSGAIASVTTLPPTERAARIGVAYWIYLRKVVCPYDLIANYAPPRESFSGLLVAASWLGLAIVSLAAIRSRQRFPYLAFGWFWYLFTFLPAIGVVPIGVQWMADRFTVIPLIGIWIAAVWGVSDWCGARKVPRYLAPALAISAVLGCSLVAARQVWFWQNSFTLYHRIVEIEPENAIAHRSLGAAYGNVGDFNRSIDYFQEAVKLSPEFSLALADLGQVLIKQRRPQEAIPYLQRSLAIQPTDPVTLYQLALAYLHLGQYEQAVEPLEKSLAIQDEQPNVHHDLGLALARLGKLSQARSHWEKSISYQPDHGMAHGHLARILANAGETPAAYQHYQQAIQLVPDWPQPLEELAWMVAVSNDRKIQNTPFARELAQRGVERFGPTPQLLAALAATSAAQGDYPEATKLATRAAELAKQSSLDKLAAEYQLQSQAYRDGKQPKRTISFPWL